MAGDVNLKYTSSGFEKINSELLALEKKGAEAKGWFSGWNQGMRKMEEDTVKWYKTHETSFKNAYEGVTALTGGVIKLTAAVGGIAALVGGAGVAAFASWTTSILKTRESFAQLEIAMYGATKSWAAVNKVSEFAKEYAATYPAMYRDVMQAMQAMSFIPSLSPIIKGGDVEGMKEMMHIVQGLMTMRPEQGVQGAIFALREALAGNWRSLQMRFDVPVASIARSANMTMEQMKESPQQSVKALKAWIDTFVGADTMAMAAKNLTIQIGNLKDKYQIWLDNLAKSGIYQNVIDKLLKMNDVMDSLLKSDKLVRWTKEINNALETVVNTIGDVFTKGVDWENIESWGELKTALVRVARNASDELVKVWNQYKEPVGKALETMLLEASFYVGKAIGRMFVPVGSAIIAGIIQGVRGGVAGLVTAVGTAIQEAFRGGGGGGGGPGMETSPGVPGGMATTEADKIKARQASVQKRLTEIRERRLPQLAPGVQYDEEQLKQFEARKNDEIEMIKKANEETTVYGEVTKGGAVNMGTAAIITNYLLKKFPAFKAAGKRFPAVAAATGLWEAATAPQVQTGPGQYEADIGRGLGAWTTAGMGLGAIVGGIPTLGAGAGPGAAVGAVTGAGSFLLTEFLKKPLENLKTVTDYWFKPQQPPQPVAPEEAAAITKGEIPEGFLPKTTDWLTDAVRNVGTRLKENFTDLFGWMKGESKTTGQAIGNVIATESKKMTQEQWQKIRLGEAKAMEPPPAPKAFQASFEQKYDFYQKQMAMQEQLAVAKVKDQYTSYEEKPFWQWYGGKMSDKDYALFKEQETFREKRESRLTGLVSAEENKAQKEYEVKMREWTTVKPGEKMSPKEKGAPEPTLTAPFGQMATAYQELFQIALQRGEFGKAQTYMDKYIENLMAQQQKDQEIAVRGVSNLDEIRKNTAILAGEAVKEASEGKKTGEATTPSSSMDRMTPGQIARELISWIGNPDDFKNMLAPEA